MQKIKEIFKNPLNVIIAIPCIIASMYFTVLLFKEIKPKNWKEQRIECLKLGSDSARVKCLRIINE